MIKFIKIIIILCIPLIMGGCALPPIITYLGYAKTAADGISYLVYKKSTTDYALSYVRGKDCALHRTFTEEEVCKTEHLDRLADEMLESGDFEALALY